MAHDVATGTDFRNPSNTSLPDTNQSQVQHTRKTESSGTPGGKAATKHPTDFQAELSECMSEAKAIRAQAQSFAQSPPPEPTQLGNSSDIPFVETAGKVMGELDTRIDNLQDDLHAIRLQLGAVLSRL